MNSKAGRYSGITEREIRAGVLSFSPFSSPVPCGALTVIGDRRPALQSRK